MRAATALVSLDEAPQAQDVQTCTSTWPSSRANAVRPRRAKICPSHLLAGADDAYDLGANALHRDSSDEQRGREALLLAQQPRRMCSSDYCLSPLLLRETTT